MRYLIAVILLFICVSGYCQYGYQGQTTTSSLTKPQQIRKTVSPGSNMLYVIGTKPSLLTPSFLRIQDSATIASMGVDQRLTQPYDGTYKLSRNFGASDYVYAKDSSFLNEIQSLSIFAGKGTIKITNGLAGASTFIQLADSSILNEIQTLSKPTVGTLKLTNLAAGASTFINLPDSSQVNEGSLSVTAGGATTSVLHSNTSGATDVVFSAGTGIALSENIGAGIITVATTGLVPTTTTISTTAPLSGGGDLSTNRTITTSMSTNKLIGRASSGTGVMEEITLGNGLSYTSTTLNVASQTLSRYLLGLKLTNYNAASTYLSLPDSTSSNEGSLSVTAGTASTSVIHSNTESSTDVTLSAGTGITLSENTGTGTITISGNSGTVTSVAIAVPTGMGVSGSPITSSGTITLSLANDLAALEGLSSTGIAVRTTTDTWAQRTIVSGTAANITIGNGNGVSANPSVDLTATAVTPGTYGASGTHVGQFTVDAYGRITAASNTSISLTGIGGVSTARNLNTAGMLSGGGDLSSDRTFTTSIATNKLVGRYSASTGVFEAVGLGAGFSFSGGNLTYSETGSGTLKHVKHGTAVYQVGLQADMNASKDTATISLLYNNMPTVDSFLNIKADYFAVSRVIDDINNNAKITAFNFLKGHDPRVISTTGTKNYDFDDSYNIIIFKTASAIVYKLPSSPTEGEQISFVNLRSSATYPQLDGNGKNINGSATYNFTSLYEKVKLRYFTSEGQWLIIP